MLTKFLYFIAIFCWASLVTLPWLWMLGQIDFNAGSITAEILFFVLALFSTVPATSEDRKK